MSEQGTVRVGLLAYGAIGHEHNLAVQATDGLELTAVADLNPERVAAAREARTCANNSGSDRTRKLSSKDSRSSWLKTTAAGRPCFVIVTRAWWSSTCSITSDKRSLTSAKGSSLAIVTKVSIAVY